jgi:hypothetical protein
MVTIAIRPATASNQTSEWTNHGRVIPRPAGRSVPLQRASERMGVY